jgi:hypothetical protein
MMEKEMYTAPEVEIIEVEVEQGFQASGLDPEGGNA